MLFSANFTQNNDSWEWWSIVKLFWKYGYTVYRTKKLVDTNDDDTPVEDDEGQDLADAEAARKIALAALPDMARDKMPNGDHRTFCASVRDQTGVVIYEASLTLVGTWKAGGSAP